MLLTRTSSMPVGFALVLGLLVASPAAATHVCETREIDHEDGQEKEIIEVCEPHADTGGGNAGGGGGGDGVTCTTTYDGDSGGGDFVNQEDGSSWGHFERRCSDGSYTRWWACAFNCPSGEPGQPVDWLAIREGLVQRVSARVELPLPGISTSAANPRANGGPMAIVHSETWWWADAWDPVVEEDLNGPLWVQVTATPTALTVDPGDGSDALVCEDGGTVYDYYRLYFDQQGGSDCFHVYTATSADQPDQMVTITATAAWEIRWEAGGVAAAAGSGVLSTPTVTETMRLPVGEIQSVISGYGR